MPRPPKPDDLYRLRVPIGLRLSPDGRNVVTALKVVAPDSDASLYYDQSTKASAKGEGIQVM